MVKTVTFAVISKGVTMAAVLYLVLTSHLTDFEKGLIIAIVSATITGAFTVLGAWLAARYTRPVQARVDEVHQDLHDVKKKVDSDRREADQQSN